MASAAGNKILTAIFGPSIGSRLSNSESASASSASSSSDVVKYLSGLMSSNAEENEKNREYNSVEAQKYRDWSSHEAELAHQRTLEMSNTQYQRAVADLQEAGLNPILAYDNGGASASTFSAPSGSSASYNTSGGDTLSDVLNSLSNLISSATGIGQLAKSVSSSGATTTTKTTSTKSGNTITSTTTSSKK